MARRSPSGNIPSTAAPEISINLISVLVGLALLSAWIAAGSAGLMGHALRHTLAISSLVLLVLSAFSARNWRIADKLAVLAVLILSIVGIGLSMPAIGVLCVAATVAALLRDPRLKTLQPLLAGIVLFALYRFAATSIPGIWLLSDRIASIFGSLAGWPSGSPLNVGPTFGGIDLLVLSLSFALLWSWGESTGRTQRLAFVIPEVLVIHIGYLTLIAATPTLLQWFADSTWKDLAAEFLPWNLPVVGVALLTLLCVLISRVYRPAPIVCPRRGRWILILLAGSAILPVVSTLSPTPLSLENRKIVFFEKGFLNWLRPTHGEGYGRLSIGMYGMLSQFLEMHGAHALISKDLSDADLSGANALVLIYPDKKWEDGQLDRIRKFVRDGGTLLVMGEHTIHGPDADEEKPPRQYWPGEAQSRFNDAISESRIRVNFDSATFAIGGWLQSYEAIAHPITAGVNDTKNEFGSVIGASLNVKFPAKPILIGRWGWSDLGDEGSAAAMMGNHKYDAGERLGDIILAAEDNVGNGRVIVFGDTSAITNGINVGCHDSNARLYAYITNSSLNPQSLFRQAIGFTILLAMVAAVTLSGSPGACFSGTIVLVVATLISTSISHSVATLLPDGRLTSPNRLAYIDQSHLEAASQESWREDGTMGVGMCLMRDGYVFLTMPEFSKERLERSSLLISVAPNRPYSSAERETLKQWINDGGTFILTVGWPDRAGSQSLLDDLGFGFGKDYKHPATEENPPEPQGFFKAPYVEANGYRAHVRFHAAWPIWCMDENAKPIANGTKDTSIIVMRPMGKGKVIVVGDTNFCTNQNLEHESGEAFDGMHENNDFWRWLITRINDQEQWIPPNPNPTTQPTTGGAQ